MTYQPTLEEEYWLALARAPGVGPVTFIRLLKHFGSPRQVFEAGPLQWQAQGLKAEQLDYLLNPDWYAVEKDMEWLNKPDNHLLILTHPDYPTRLRDIHDPPPLLFVHGDVSLLSSLQLAMVGTRNPSDRGKRLAWEFADYLATKGFTITSGMALGIDAACHEGALHGSGRTLAVAGTGVDRVYPSQHRDLAHRIAKMGAIVSEFMLGTSARPANFPRRNRIISGLSIGTLVVEAPLNSGALYTAYQALEQGREVFAIPDSIHNPLAKGCHKLIKQGAKLVETAVDIVEELLNYFPSLTLQTLPTSLSNSEPLVDTAVKPPSPASPPALPGMEDIETETDYINLLKHLSTAPTSIDNLVELSGLTVEAISSMLLILELRGIVTSLAGGLYARR